MAWQPVGLAMGVYDVCARYVKQREQFGSPLGGFQLVQERLVRMLGNVQVRIVAALYLRTCMRIPIFAHPPHPTRRGLELVRPYMLVLGSVSPSKRGCRLC